MLDRPVVRKRGNPRSQALLILGHGEWTTRDERFAMTIACTIRCSQRRRTNATHQPTGFLVGWPVTVYQTQPSQHSTMTAQQSAVSGLVKNFATPTPPIVETALATFVDYVVHRLGRSTSTCHWFLDASYDAISPWPVSPANDLLRCQTWLLGT